MLLAGCKQNTNMSTLNLTQEWDKTFPKSDLVEHSKVTFHNRYGIELAADLYIPKNAEGRLPAIALSGPFGAVKEQTSGIYAQHMAERGFLTIAFDPSYTGESGGEPRRMASPDINTEDFLAAVDFLSVQENVDPERIGIIGICGWGGMAINAAALDPRIKATVTSTMYDMSRVTREGYFGCTDSEQARDALRKAWAAQRTEDYKTGSYKRAGGVVDPLPDDAPWFVKDYYDYYKTERGYHPRSGNSNDGWNIIGTMSFMNQPILDMAREIKTPVLLIHGEKAHSRYFSEGAFEAMTGVKPEPGKTTVMGNKELLIIPGAVHTDLYDDKAGVIPYDRIESFFKGNLMLASACKSDNASQQKEKEPMAADGIVRLSKIEVHPQYLDEYMKFAIEVWEVSLRTEPGVLTMYAVAEKDNPCLVTILETYASKEAYEKHIASEHFQKYKQGTLHMVKSLILSDQTPLNPANRINNFIQ